MNKKFICILITAILIVLVISVQITQKQKSQRLAARYNAEYEQYLNKEIYGTDVVSIINKAINSNERNNVLKDQNGNYIENDDNSIKVDVYIKINNKTYNMETIAKIGMEKFVKNFNLLTFTCSKIEYHEKTGKVSNIYIEQLEEV